MARRVSSGGRPRVTAIVAARNEEAHIRQCLDSLVNQSYPALEIIVVDDGSTDATGAIAAAVAGVRLLHQPPRGKATAINAAAGIATGDVLLFLDADMYFDREYVELLVAPILAGACLGTAHGTELVANPAGTWSRCLQARFGLPTDKRLALSDAQLGEGSVVFRAVRRQAFLDVGGFDEIGFMDDQTLYPKLKARARWIAGAVCWHYNFESLGEVYGSGRWAARSIRHLHGRKAVLSYLPVLSLWLGLRQAMRHGLPALVPFVVVYELGIFIGLLRG